MKNKKISRFLPITLLLVFFLSLILGAGAACTLPISKIDIANDNILKFAHISDVHLDSNPAYNAKRLYAHSAELFQDAINQINNTQGVNFVVFSGDQINKPVGSDLRKFANMANKLNMPWYAALGNHDIGINSSFNKKKYLDILNKSNPNYKNYKPYYSFTPKKGFLVIVMDGVIDSKITANGYFDKKQLNWLDKQLTDNQNSKAIIVQHFPLVEPFNSSSHKINNDTEYLNLLNKHKNVIAVLSGHYHSTKITKVGNIIHVSTPALVQYPNAFRIITIDSRKNKTVFKFQFIETGLKNLQQLGKEKAGSSSLSYGQPSDRDTVIEINK